MSSVYPVREFPAIPADGISPVDMLDHLCATRHGPIAMLHSRGPDEGEPGETVIGFDPLRHFEAGADQNESAMGVLQEHVERFAFSPPHRLVGWLGFIGYDEGLRCESVAQRTPAELRWPRAHWTLFRNYLVYDHQTRWYRPFGLAGSDPVEAIGALRKLDAVEGGAARLVEAARREAFCEKIERVKAYIAAGDIYQANLAQRWKIRTDAPATAIYRRLMRQTPARYAAFLRLAGVGVNGGRYALCASPELFLEVEGGRTVTRPIKGTRPRDLSDPQRDAQLRWELLESAKDRAELAMIVDLLRNDLGRVSQYGSVEVAQAREVEALPTLWHTVATIRSRLREGVGIAELLKALLPGGSITGAPKIRAMQIIEELEGFRRELYCGNIGVISPRGMILNIAIRTILMQEGMAYVYAGGGIVADSDSQREYEETLHKAAALFRALGVESPL